MKLIRAILSVVLVCIFPLSSTAQDQQKLITAENSIPSLEAKIAAKLAQAEEFRQNVKNDKFPLSKEEYSRMMNGIDLYEQAIKKNPDDVTTEAQFIALREALIAHDIDNYDRGPKRIQITSRTTDIIQATYYKAAQSRIEKVGTITFPEKDGKKLYGNLIVYIPIFEDGTIYEKDGGPRVERSSGDPYLDKASLRIVRRSAPFSPIPKEARTPGAQDVWELICRFNFTHEEDGEEQKPEDKK